MQLPSSISEPKQLVDEFKKSGEFDRLRRELLTQFERSDGIASFKSRIDDVIRQRLSSDQKLQQMSYEAMHRELMQEIDRYPIVERALADIHALSDPEFIESVRGSAERILRGNQGSKSQTWPRKENGDEWNQLGASGPIKPPGVNITIRSATPVKTLEGDDASIPQPRAAAAQHPTLPASTPPPVVVLEPSTSAAEAGASQKMDTSATVLSDITPKQISNVATNGRGEVPDVDMANETTTENSVENTLHD